MCRNVCDTTKMLHQALKEDEYIVCEGAQATLLDIDFGKWDTIYGERNWALNYLRYA